MYRINIQPKPPDSPKLANHIHHQSTKTELAKYYHQCCFSPAVSTFTAAIKKGFFASWPGLTEQLVRKFLPPSEATAAGHLRQQYQNTQSTKRKCGNIVQSTKNSPEPRDMFMDVYQPSGRIYTDQTGRFPVTSCRGYQYIMVLYDHDSNAILSRPLKSRHATELTRACGEMLDVLLRSGLTPCFHQLDNEAPAELKQLIRSKGVKYQLVPPGIHRRNAAERAISTWKDHFIAGLATADAKFPLNLWCHLLPQCDATLNLMRPSRVNPHVSAYQVLHGTFDFNATPVAPPGTRAVIHDKPSKRATWAPHGTAGWYIAPAMEHYRCYKVYCSKTRKVRITDTIELMPSKCAVPTPTNAELAIKAASDLTAALTKPCLPLQPVGDQQLQALKQLESIFATAAGTQPTASLPRVPTPTRAIDTRQTTTCGPTQTGPPQALPTDTHSRPRVAPTAPPVTDDEAESDDDDDSDDESDHEDDAQPHPATAIPRTRLRTGAIQRRQWSQHTSKANAVIDERTGTAYEYRHLIAGKVHGHTPEQWYTSFANEIGRLAQGIGTRIPASAATNTIFFVPRSAVPRDRTVTYGRIVCAVRPQKAETHRTRLTVGGNLIDYPFDVHTPTAELTTAKCLFNSVVSTPQARFMTIDIKDFYLNTDMKRYEYMRMPVAMIPPEIIEQYQLRKLEHNGNVYVEVRKGMYGLPQAGKIANVKLQKHLAKFGYRPVPHTPGLWKHDWRPITFTLVVDDFGVKYVGKEHAQHLITALQTIYKCTIEWDGDLYCGVSLKWDYEKRTVGLSMPGYIQKALHKFQHPLPTRPQHSPAKCEAPQYGAKTQEPKLEDTSPELPAADIIRIRQIVGTLLYYARAVDPTILPAVSDIATQQAHATQTTAHSVKQLLDYCATHPHATIEYKASDMILHVDSDASYLSLPKARSRAGGHMYLSAKSIDGTKAPTCPPPNNGAIHTVCNKIQNVMSSAAEAEVGALYMNCNAATALRTTLAELGHEQPPTPIKTDNSTASGIVNNTMKQRRTRAMDMRFYWVRDRVQQGHFIIYWAPGADNLADYFTKHHPTAHHRKMREVYLKPTPDSSKTAGQSMLGVTRGCIDSTPARDSSTRRTQTAHLAPTFSLEQSKTLAEVQTATPQYINAISHKY